MRGDHLPRSRTIGSLPQLLRTALRGDRKLCLACAAAEDPSLIESVGSAVQLGLVDPVLFGDSTKVMALARRLGVSLAGVSMIDEPDAVRACQKAVALCRSGGADALMKGAVSTATILGAVLNGDGGLKTGRTLSHATVFRPLGFRRLLILADAGVNIAPDVDCKFEIIRGCVELAHSLGIARPRVALLAASEKVTEKLPSTMDAAEIIESFRDRCGEVAYVGGPYALDVAVSRDAAQLKGLHDEVAGRADILLVPNIEAGNILYKALTCFAGLDLASIVLGAAAPLVIPSRADSSRTKLYSIALARHVARAKAFRP